MRKKAKIFFKRFLAVSFVFVNIASVVLYPVAPALAASYTFTQTGWDGYASPNATFVHSGGAVTGTTFSATSSQYVTTGSSISLATTTDSFLQQSWASSPSVSVAKDSTDSVAASGAWSAFSATSTNQVTTGTTVSLTGRTGSFAQTNWTSINQTTTATDASNQSGWTSASTTEATIDYWSTPGSLQIASTTTSWTQTDDGTTGTGFNYSGSATSSTAVAGTGSAASVGLSGTNIGFSATGGTLTYTDSSGLNSRSSPAYAGGYTVHTFTASSTFQVVSGSANVDYLVVGGGGRGGRCNVSGCNITMSGGGGAGGFLTGSNHTVTTQSYPVTVGAGAASFNTSGANSVFDGITAYGGGPGGNSSAAPFTGTNGGSGGGGGGDTGTTGTYAPGTGTAGQGNNGGNGVVNTANTSAGGGGGGGAGANGATGVANSFDGIGGAGGIGSTSAIAGLTTCPNGGTAPNCYYAGGGGGGFWDVGPNGAGGLGGGGSGGTTAAAADGKANSGGGGGGTKFSIGGGAGGSGVVILRYLTPTYASSGTFTSAVYDTGQSSDFGIVSWNTATSTLTMQVRTGTNASIDGTWTGLTSVTNGADTGTTFDGKRYVQYQATLTSPTGLYTPSLDDVTVNYKYYPTASSYALTSSVFDTQDSAAGITSLAWTAATTSAASVKLQVRTSPDGIAWSAWCGPTNCSGTDYFIDTNNSTSISNTAITDGVADRYFQYKAILATTDSGQNPQLNNLTVNYARVLQTSTLTSSVFNTEDAADGIWKAQWDQTGTSTGGNIRMQIATSSDGTTFSSYFGPTGTGSYFSSVSTGCSATSDGVTVTCTTMPGTGLASQYFKYQAEITPNANNTSPSVDNVQLYYKRIFDLTSGTTLTSSPYDSGSSVNVIGSLALTLSSLPAGSSAKIQIRTASTQGGLSSATWCGTDCSGSTYFTASAVGANSFSSIPAALADGANDEWFQYRVTLIPTSDSVYAPMVTSAGVTYVVNEAPTSNVTAATVQAQIDTNITTVTVTYNLTDVEVDSYEAYLFYNIGVTLTSDNTTTLTVSDTSKLPAAPGFVQIGTEVVKYGAITNGTTLGTLTRGGTDGSWPGTSTRHTKPYTSGSVVWVKAGAVSGAVGTVSKANGQTITWTPSSEANLANYSNATAQVRVLVHDGNVANMLSSQNGSSVDSSANVFIDNVKPVNASPVLTFDAGVGGVTNSGSISINHPTDATTTQYLISDNAGVATSWTSLSGAGPTILPWTFDDAVGVKSVNVKFRDLYGNAQVATTTLSTVNPPLTASFLVQDVSKASTLDWKLYIGWETATSTIFASYKLEYATSTDNTTYGNYADVTVITDKTINYYVHSGLNTNWYYRYRVGVKDTNGNTTMRSRAFINAKPDALQNLGEGGGGASPTAPVVTNIVPTQNSNGTVSVTYNLTDSSLSSKSSPSYEGYVFYNIGATFSTSTASTIVLSDTSKLPASGYIQINNEIIKYTTNTTGTGTLSGITRGTWPNYLSSTRTTRQNTNMLAGIPVWIAATSTATTITNTSISTGQSGNITWTTSNDTNIANTYNTNVGIRIVVHDNQLSTSGPISTQNDLSDGGTFSILDLKAPVLTSTSLLINGSSSTTESSSANATLSLTGITGDTSNESILIQFATSTPAVWRGANSDGTINMTPDSWGTATSTASILGSWSWPLSGRSETITARIKDAFGNISNTDTNSNQKNTVPEFNGTQTDADASGYVTSTNSNIVIRQCNVFDTDSLCTTGKVKVTFQVRDADTAQGAVTPGYVNTLFATSLNSGAYATSTITTYSDGLVDVTAGKSGVNANGTTFTTVTAYYDPGISSSATLGARIAVTDNESGTTLQWATSNTINYDKVNPSGSVTFDGGVAGTVSSGTITIPVPTDATTTQYMISATSTAGTLTTYGWTTLSGATTLSHGFDSAIDSKSVFYRFRDMFGNTSATGTVSALLPPLASTLSVQDISKASSSTWRTFISWEVSTSSGFSLYRLEYATSTDNSTYTAYSDLITIPTISTNYYLHSGLSNTLYYRYRLSMKNTSGNYSVKSNAYFAAKPDGTLNMNETSADDTAAPSINTVTSTGVKATLATVTFNSTDNASLAMNSSVYYAAQADFTTNVGSAKTGRDKYVYKFGNPTYVTVGSIGATAAHSVALTGLTKNLTYRYGVEVCDATGNCTFEDASSAGYAFTTANGPAIVGGSVVATPAADSSSITWKTDNPADSEVFYATSSAAMSINPIMVGSTSQVTSADGNGQYVHTVTISNLAYNTSYHYKVRSVDQNSSSISYTQYDESATTSFTTTSQSTPIITVASTCSTTDSTAIVSWTTDQVSTTEISLLTSNTPANYFSIVAGAQYAQYPLGATTLINDTARLSFDYVTSHSNTFTGLSESTAYYAKVRSLNRSGGEVSSTLTCTTIAKQVVTIGRSAAISDTTPPVISSLIIKDIKGTSVTITWLTDELADSLVKYGKTSNYGSLNGSEETVPTHSVTLSGLIPETTYDFKVTSADAYGNRAYTGDQTFTTVSIGDEAITTKEQLQALQQELQDLKDKAINATKKAQSLAQAVAQFKNILKSVSTDVSLQDLESLTSDITDTITDITQQVTPPNILGGVPQVEVESNKVTVTWRTNKTSNSIIALVPQDEYDAKAANPYTVQVGQPQDDVSNHVVVIPNLQAATTYHFQIRSKARIGPEGRSRDFVFETKQELPIILDYSFKNIGENSITVAWKTNVVSTSQIKYTPFIDGRLDENQSRTEGKPDFSTTHEVTTTNMTPNTNFQIEISSADISGGVASKIIGTIRTTIDVKAPVISKVRSESTLFPGKVEKTQTIIYWETDEPASSQIFWKEGVAKGDLAASSRLDKELTTNHVVVLTSFTPGAVYRFQVESIDASGNKARSTDYTLLTSKKGETVIDLIITNFQDIFGFLKKL